MNLGQRLELEELLKHLDSVEKYKHLQPTIELKKKYDSIYIKVLGEHKDLIISTLRAVSKPVNKREYKNANQLKSVSQRIEKIPLPNCEKALA